MNITHNPLALITITLMFAPAGWAEREFTSPPNASPNAQRSAPGFVLDDDYIGGSVSRAMFTRAVVNHEPIDQISHITTNRQHVYYFTELKGLTGETIKHRWEFNGNVVEEMEFEVGGPRWRVWSSRTLQPEKKGEWKVIVVDTDGHIIRESRLPYILTKSKH